ncbi:hypothetical protein RI367_008469 [Sorochytrium milnesiophthora]
MEPNQEAVFNNDVDEQHQSLEEASLDRDGNAPDTEDSGVTANQTVAWYRPLRDHVTNALSQNQIAAVNPPHYENSAHIDFVHQTGLWRQSSTQFARLPDGRSVYGGDEFEVTNGDRFVLTKCW